MMDAAYCYLCDQMVEVELKKEKEEHVIKGMNVFCEVENPYCRCCGNQVYIPKINDRNLDIIDHAYRGQNGIITKDEIEGLLKQYDIGAKPLATLLGWSEATIIRYLKGQIPNRAHSDTLKRLHDPREFETLFDQNQDKLTSPAKKKTANALQAQVSDYMPALNEVDSRVRSLLDAYTNQPSEFNGFTSFNLQKLIQVILYFAAMEQYIYKTKMNKLLWYSDMLRYKRTGYTSLTGLSYKHNYYGPTPHLYSYLYGSLQDIYITLIDDQLGEYIEPLKSYSRDALSKEEQLVLHDVMEKFKNWNAQSISEYSHKEKAYRENEHSGFISFSYAEDLSLS